MRTRARVQRRRVRQRVRRSSSRIAENQTASLGARESSASTSASSIATLPAITSRRRRPAVVLESNVVHYIRFSRNRIHTSQTSRRSRVPSIHHFSGEKFLTVHNSSFWGPPRGRNAFRFKPRNDPERHNPTRAYEPTSTPVSLKRSENTSHEHVLH